MRKTEWTALAIVILAVIGSIVLLINEQNKNKLLTTDINPIGTMETNTSPSNESNELIATAGKSVTVHYTGKFADGTVFDSSVTRGTPFTFTLGTGQVIKGWDQGIEGMRVGEKKQLVIPPELGYGSQDYGPIPGGSTLYFDVELLAVN